jgi:hypothetical protein
VNGHACAVRRWLAGVEKLAPKRLRGRGRTNRAETAGYHVVRFWSHDVLGNPEAVRDALAQEVNISVDRLIPTVSHRGEEQIVA